jgi:hypothetical protein
MFITGGPVAGQLGTDQQYGKIRDYFTRRKDDVSTELDTLVAQMQDLVGRLAVPIQSFELSEVRFELGFSAEGHLGFIAKAGAHGSVHVAFARRAVLPGKQQPGWLEPGRQEGEHMDPNNQDPFHKDDGS